MLVFFFTHSLNVFFKLNAFKVLSGHFYPVKAIAAMNYHKYEPHLSNNAIEGVVKVERSEVRTSSRYKCH